MGMRIALGKNLAPGAAAPASVKVRTSKPPYLFQSDGSYTGNMVVEHSVDSWADFPNDADASWATIATLTAAAPTVIWAAPLYRVRSAGGPTGGAVAGSVFMVERQDRD